jgi:hypothetical protein
MGPTDPLIDLKKNMRDGRRTSEYKGSGHAKMCNKGSCRKYENIYILLIHE